MSLISNFKTGFLDSYSILLLLLIGLPWRLLKHMHSQLYTLQEVSPWCDKADVFDAPLNWFAWSKRNSDTLHELLTLSTQKQDTSTQIFFFEKHLITTEWSTQCACEDNYYNDTKFDGLIYLALKSKKSPRRGMFIQSHNVTMSISQVMRPKLTIYSWTKITTAISACSWLV